MSDPGQPVIASAETLAVLVHDFETGESGKELDELARELGVAAPDERDGWDVVYRWGPNGEDMGLFWLHPADDPSYPSD